MNRFSRRGLVGALLAAPAAARAAHVAHAVHAAGFVPEPDDMAMGAPRARVVVVEYASAGCPHCAVWANEVFPAFKARFIDTGKVRFVLREMNFGDPTVAAAGFMLARCLGPAKYFEVLDQVFRQQAIMFEPGQSPNSVLGGIARNFGMSELTFNSCLDDDAAIKAFNARADRHRISDRIRATPTFEVSGRRLLGDATLDDLARAIAAARRGA